MLSALQVSFCFSNGSEIFLFLFSSTITNSWVTFVHIYNNLLGTFCTLTSNPRRHRISKFWTNLLHQLSNFYKLCSYVMSHTGQRGISACMTSTAIGSDDVLKIKAKTKVKKVLRKSNCGFGEKMRKCNTNRINICLISSYRQKRLLVLIEFHETQAFTLTYKFNCKSFSNHGNLVWTKWRRFLTIC